MKAALTLATLVVAASFSDWFNGLWGGPLHLSCSGRSVSWYKGESREITRTIQIDIDLSDQTVEVESFIPSYKIKSIEAKEVKFWVGPDNVADSGSLNRYTGVVSVFEGIPNGAQEFHGQCRRAERLF